jgi:uncharacterized membrane protein
MLKTAVIIILSFFAVIGFIECIFSLLETVSTSRYKKIKDIALVVELSGAVENVTFLLNTLLLQAERISYRDAATRVVIRDCGLDEDTYSQIHSFCEENDNITVEM